VRYAVRGNPLWIACCHCESCRRATSAAFATYAGFRKERFTLTSGKPRPFSLIARRQPRLLPALRLAPDL